MGIIFSQKSSLIPDITVQDNLLYYGAMYEIEKTEITKRILELDAVFDIKKFLDQPVRKLSFGQRMKVELVSILLHRPKYILLDEATIGLDIFVKQDLLNVISKYNKQYHSTIIITTHEIEFLEVCEWNN